MPTLFTKIIEGEIPGTFVWRDDICVAFMTIAPIKPGHVLVVPREEVDHWIDLDDQTRSHLMDVSAQIGQSLQRAFSPTRVGLMIAGLEVPHVHVHLVPIDSERDLDFANADTAAERSDLESAAERIRVALRQAGAGGVTA